MGGHWGKPVPSRWPCISSCAPVSELHLSFMSFIRRSIVTAVFCVFLYFCVHACVAACCRFRRNSRVQLWLSSATLILHLTVFKLTLCVLFSGVSAVVCTLSMCLYCVRVNVSDVCQQSCRCLRVCVCVVKTQLSVGALMSKCTLLSLLLGFM